VQLQAHGRALRLGGYEVAGRKRYDDNAYRTPTLTLRLREAIKEDITLDKYVLPARTTC
jgi:hypothetical protein